jgi:hypothetical protein
MATPLFLKTDASFIPQARQEFILKKRPSAGGGFHFLICIPRQIGLNIFSFRRDGSVQAKRAGGNGA